MTAAACAPVPANRKPGNVLLPGHVNGRFLLSELVTYLKRQVVYVLSLTRLPDETTRKKM